MASWASCCAWRLSDLLSGHVLAALFALDAAPWDPWEAAESGQPRQPTDPEYLYKLKDIVDAEFGLHVHNVSTITGTDQVAVAVSSTRMLGADLTERIRRMCASVQAKFGDACEQSVTVGLGTVVMGLDHLSQSYEEALDPVSSRFKLGRGLVLESQAVPSDNQTFIYPAGAERMVLDGLRLGNLQTLEEGLGRFIAEVNPCSSEEISLAVDQLAFASARVADELSSTLRAGLVMNKRALKQDLESLQTLEDVESYLKYWYRSVLERLNESRSSRRTDLIKRVKQLVAERHVDTYLSLHDLASAVSLSPGHLRTLFRENCGENAGRLYRRIPPAQSRGTAGRHQLAGGGDRPCHRPVERELLP